jgi:tRNA threonylcarbamoyl adenosine modification protein YeaZ
MHCLFLNLASHSGLLACVTDARVTASEGVDHRLGDHELLPRIQRMLGAAGWSFSDLTQVACVLGPGGFTSLRVAVACANTLSDQLRIPSAGIHLSDLCGARVASSAAEMRAPFLWVHSTKREQLFVRGFGVGPWEEPTLISLTDLLSHVRPGTSFCGELLPEHRQAIEAAEARELSQHQREEVLPPFLRSRRYARDILFPWYGRGY